MSAQSKQEEKQQAHFYRILEDLLKLQGNDNCADCGSKGPRWASVNLGIFVCIRCSGIHRNMGTHISKVKSVSLDKWQPDMVRNMQIIGNANARRIYEGNLPGGYHRPRESDAYAIEQWIRDKYDRKRWFDRVAFEQVSSGKSVAPDSPASTGSPSNSDSEDRRARREERRRKREERQREEERRSQEASRKQQANLLIDATEPTPTQQPPAQDNNFLFSEFQSAGSANATSFFEGTNANAAFFQGQAAPAAVPAPAATPVPTQAPGSSKESIMSLFRAPVAANPAGNYGGANNLGGLFNTGAPQGYGAPGGNFAPAGNPYGQMGHVPQGNFGQPVNSYGVPAGNFAAGGNPYGQMGQAQGNFAYNQPTGAYPGATGGYPQNAYGGNPNQFQTHGFAPATTQPNSFGW